MPLRWRVRPQQPDLQATLARELSVDPIVAQILINRGYDSADAARQFLDAPPGELTDPDRLIDAAKAADRLAAAIRGGELITIYGDYDADGVSATSILLRGLSALGGRVAFYIPSRFAEGYGLNDPALARIGSEGGRLVVAVDCGVGAVDEIARAASRGQQLIVVDHHLPPAELPPAFAIVDPKRALHPSAASGAGRSDSEATFSDYCAAGLAFQLLRAVRSRLGRADLPEDVLDLAALGTIADVVPLVGDNRILARWGLAKMASTPTPGLAALIRAAELSGPLSARHVSFSLAPRINAAGRLGDASVAVRLLTTGDPAEAETLAAGLDAENRRRQAINEQILAEAVEQVESRKLAEGPAIVLSAAGWHAGVIGIVASHLVERYYRPVVMIAVDGAIGKGSGRSIAGLHLVETLSECGDLLERFGGHAMAAGLTIDAARIDEFGRRFTEAAGLRLTPDALVPSLQIDAEVPLGSVTESLAGQLERLAPFGAGNPEPVLAVRGVRAVTTRVLGDGLHLKLGVTDGTAYAEAIGFRLGDASELLAFTQAELDLAFTVALDRWNDKPRVQLVVRDLQTPGVDLDAVLMDGGLLIDRLFTRAGDYLANGALGIEDAAAFYTKVAGVSYDDRQTTVAALAAGDALVLTREPDNAHDPHAIRVSTTAGEQVGYLSARLAARLAPLVDAGERYTATVSQVTGGGDRHHGVNVYIRRAERWTADDHPGRATRAALASAEDDELIERLRAHLLRGRRLRAAQLEAIHAVLGGRSVHAVFGAGKARTSVIEVSAAAAVIRGVSGPVVIALPLQSQVDRLEERLGPRLRRVGIRCVRAHGALLFRQRQRLLEALHDGTADVVIASHAYLLQHPVSSPLLLAETEPTIGANLLAELLQGSGRRMQVVVFSSDTAGGREVIADSFVRAGLRLSDRRGAGDRFAVCAEVAGRGEKTMIFVSSRGEAVALAQQLRGERSGESEIAYYHGGLPLRVREVLEQMYADGTIRVLVAADGFSEDVAPPDVRQVVVAGLTEDTATLAGQLGLGGLDGRQAMVTLAYRREDGQVLRAQLAERHPPREVLAAVYRAVRDLSASSEPVTWPDGPLTNALGSTVPSRRTVSIALDILAEAAVLQREFDGQHWRVSLPPDTVRRELATSLRYTEGQREYAALDAVERWAFGPLAEMLRAVAGPGVGTGAKGAIDAIDA
jgi:single-stranded-DNA-specific exonuclease